MENEIINLNGINNCYPLVEGIDENGYGLLSVNAEELIIGVENKKKEITEIEERMNGAWHLEMEKRGITKINTNKLQNFYKKDWI